MEFNQRRPKKNLHFDDEVPKVKPSSNWFDEDEEWAELTQKVKEDSKSGDSKRRFLKKKKSSAFDAPPEEDLKKVEVNIKLALPKIDVARFRGLKKIASPFAKVKKLRPTKRNIAIGSVALILIVAGIVVGNKYLLNNKSEGAEVAGVSNSKNQANSDKVFEGVSPEFPILYPGDKNKDSIGKIIKNSPPNNPPVYVYVDKIGEVSVQVSQQQLPDRFKENQDGELQKLAESFQATKPLQVDSVKVFQGENESGVQSLIFIKGNLLFLVAASQPVSDEVWVAYISSLHS